MNNLLQQIMKFGLVGVFCFFVDYFLYLFANLIFEKSGIAAIFTGYYLISAFIGFTVSVVVNYILSFKFVFVRRDDMSRKKEFFIFLVLSIIGLGLNELCLYVGIDLIYMNWGFLQSIMSEGFAKNLFFKFGATGIVMVYNFVTRKIFLEQKEEKN
ncbi:GtrA family protein [Butyrivibrio sp. NC2002]|uniref:GtrA family protein n=1 Tax=Butyrivibrio sp. NC2002 TaxID=1410610 RepID=UPI000569092C|nr:GtrA family protein [Butyrivibrio sp. NC2002]